MEFDQWDPNGEVVCPYDPLHVISVKRFQRHLIKCRQNHPEKDYIACPFNARHIFHRSELKYHLARCPDRKTLDHDIEQAECPETGDILRLKGKTDIPAPVDIPDSNEDWDGEIEENLAMKYTDEQKEILRKTQNSLPFIRRPNIYANERNRFCPIGIDRSNGNESDQNSNTGSISSQSSLYVKPVKYSEIKNKNEKTNSLINNAKQEAQKPLGRGALRYNNQRINAVGRGSALTLLQKMKIEDNKKQKQKIGGHQNNQTCGRGRLKEAALEIRKSFI